MVREDKWQSVRDVVGGWNTFDSPTEVADNEVTDINNMIYDGGILQIRQGSNTLYERPAGESGKALQLIRANTSDGVDYLIAVYETNFYLWHDENEEWVKINGTYAPTQIDKYYGNTTWNNGRGDDRLYGCNGTDEFFRWDLAVSTVDGSATTLDSTVTLTDGTRFPDTGGTLILRGAGGFFSQDYTSRTGNVFTLPGTLGDNVASGTSATVTMIAKPDMEIGKIVGKHGGRLITANYYGGETTLWYSVTSDPEDFTTGSGVNAASVLVISDGNGEITGFHDFGEFALIEKQDSLHRFSIKISDNLGSKLDSIIPIGSGDSIGTISQQATVKIDNKLMYPTRLNGFIAITPEASGDQVSVGREPISAKIHTLVTRLGYNLTRSAVFDNKAFWSVSQQGADIPLAILIYDTLRGKWSKIEGKSVVDFATKDDQLLYMEYTTGNIHRLFDGSYNDDNSPYSAGFFTKRHNFGINCMPKTASLIYIEGYMKTSSEFYVDVLFNEAGGLGKQTFKITPDDPSVQFSNPVVGNELGSLIPGSKEAGGVQLAQIGGVAFYRCYLAISNRYGFYSLQAKCYSNKEAFWSVSGYAVNPELAGTIPNTMVVSPLQTEDQ